MHPASVRMADHIEQVSREHMRRFQESGGSEPVRTPFMLMSYPLLRTQVQNNETGTAQVNTATLIDPVKMPSPSQVTDDVTIRSDVPETYRSQTEIDTSDSQCQISHDDVTNGSKNNHDGTMADPNNVTVSTQRFHLCRTTERESNDVASISMSFSKGIYPFYLNCARDHRNVTSPVPFHILFLCVLTNEISNRLQIKNGEIDRFVIIRQFLDVFFFQMMKTLMQIVQTFFLRGNNHLL